MLRTRLYHAGIAIVFLVVLIMSGVGAGKITTASNNEVGNTIESQESEVSQGGEATEGSQTTQESQIAEEEKINIQDIEETIYTILDIGTTSFFAGYPVNDSFLLWLTDTYGEEILLELAITMEAHQETSNTWYELTGNSMHVLWLEYGKEMQFGTYHWKDVRWVDCKQEDVTRIDFTGDINLDESWYTMTTLNSLTGGIDDCIDQNIQQELKNADISVINNEFTFSERGEALAGKAYTFRAHPDKVTLLEAFGADIASLANNHVYDYGAEALLDTVSTLENAGIATIGAGNNISDAKKAQFVVANGKKIGFVSATEIEKFYKYTKEATETEPGVLKTLNPETFISVIQEVDKQCDYLIVYVHWGIEGWNDFSTGQSDLATQFIHAGADAIIGGHPHRMQGVQFIEEVPVAYSLGNFWFSTGTLYTTIAQIQIDNNGELSLRMIPCIQQNVQTRMLTEEAEVTDFYKYLADVSNNVAIDSQGRIYNISSTEPENLGIEGTLFLSGQRYKEWLDEVDLEGFSIDIVGNRTS